MSSKKTTIIIATIAVALLVVLTSVASPRISGSFGFIGNALSPISSFFSKIGRGVGNFFGTFSQIKNLQKEEQALSLEVGELRAENAQLKEIQKENEELREQLGFYKSYDYSLVGAEIVGREPTDIIQSFTINKGSQDGISKGMPVVSSGALVGKIDKVDQKTSKILLITDPNSLVNAMLQGSRATGLLKGQVGHGLIIDTIPQNNEVNIGDTVITSGLGEDFPKGLSVGKVQELIDKEDALFKSASVAPQADFKGLEIVFVITGTK